MASYWLKRSASSPAEGPLTGGQIKRMAAAGQLPPSALLSADNAKWTPASKVKGLFPEPVAAPAPAPLVDPTPAPAPLDANTYDLAEEPAPAQPVFAAPAPAAVQPLAYASDVVPQPRNIRWYYVCASIVLTLGIVLRVFDFAYRPASSFSRSFPAGFGPRISQQSNFVIVMFSAAIALLVVIGAVGAYIYFTVWAYLAHRDFQQFTRGGYPIGPGRACGFCWIPVFNLFWLVYMPYKLAEAVEWHLGPGRPIVNTRNIMWMQLAATIAGCCIAGLPTFLHASTASQIQAGLNALWLNPVQVPMRRP